MEEGTYLQRIVRVAHMLDVRSAFASDDELRAALRSVREHETGERSVPSDELFAARKLKDAAFHPDTGE